MLALLPLDGDAPWHIMGAEPLYPAGTNPVSIAL
jgi:hypothetical protein